MAKNRELGVALTESEQLRELAEWFDSVWQLGDRRTEEEIEALFNSTSAEREQTDRSSTEGVASFRPGARVNSSMTALVRTGGSDDDAEAARKTGSETRDRLISRLSKTPGRWWADRYFELVEHLLDATGLESGDPRLVTSIPKSHERLCVMTNDRYVFTGMWQGDSDFGFILAPDFQLPENLQSNVVHPGDGYTPTHASETQATVPRFLAFQMTKDTEIPEELLDDWIEYVKIDKEYKSGSMHQQYHEPIICRVADDESFRREILTATFAAGDQ